MTDPQVFVEVTETPVKVSIDSGTPVVTIMNLEDLHDITVVHEDPIEVVVADHRPEVNVHVGGSGGLLDKSTLMEILSDSLDTSVFSPALAADIGLLRDLWLRVGRDVDQLLTELDIDHISRTAMAYTDEQISLQAIEMGRNAEGIQANKAAIDMNAEQITLQVTALDDKTTGILESQTAAIDVMANNISSTVSRLDVIESPNGLAGTVAQHTASLNQSSDRITAEVTARESLASGAVQQNTTRITQTAEALVAQITNVNDLTGRMDSAETRMTATEVVTEVLSEGLADTQYAIKAVESLSADRYGVVIEETVGGTPYVSGFELLIHPTWLASTDDASYVYKLGNLVSYADGKVYRCILEHTSSAANSPGSASSSTYWVLHADSAQSEFNVKAEHFHVITPGGLVPLFVVDGTTGAVTVNGDLVVNTIKSTNFDAQEPGESWFSLDPETGQAVFNNMVMTFGTAQAKKDFQDSVGITGALLLNWTGSQAVVTNGHLDAADAWSFDSAQATGAMIEVEVDDAFTGKLQVALNGVVLTVDVLGSRDLGDVAWANTGFSDESEASNYIDLSMGGKFYDLGGF